MNWQEVVRLVREVFDHSDIHNVVYSLEIHGVQAMSSEGESEFHAEDEVERYSEEFCLDERDLETNESKTCQPLCDEQFPI